MITRLVLIRHAKAEGGEPGLPDEERKLTKAGKRSIKARFPLTLHLLSDLYEDDVHIWSSPAVRAMQTAQVVAKALDIEDIEVHDSLYEIDTETFVSEVSEATGTVIAVGHNPFMEDLYEMIEGERRHLDKGAIASFAFDTPTVDPAEDIHAAPVHMEWYVQGPQVQRWKTLVEIERALDKAGRRIETRMENVLANPNDAEILHQFRISLRIARSLVKFVQPYVKSGVCVDLVTELKELQNPTSRLRELDLLAEVLDASSPEHAACVEVQKEERDAFGKVITKSATQKSVRRIVNQLKDIPWRKQTENHGLSETELAARVQLMREDHEWDMSELDYNDQEAVHEVRKAAKELRYVTREFSAVLPDSTDETTEQAKAVQDKLGELCDCRTNARLVVEICGPDAIDTAVRFIMRADEIVRELESER